MISLFVAASFAAAGSPLQRTPDAFGARLLNAHNVERARMRVGPLSWDPALAAGAQAYARQLAHSGSFVHSNRRARPGIGENLWMGMSGGFAPEQMIGTWASEKQWFRPGIFPHVSQADGWGRVGHYSQIIWPTTTRVGCGLTSGRGQDVLVCRYAPAGNIDGRRVP